jgi:hypothetical protein
MNLHFRDDDPLQWPHPWVPEYPHLPCITTELLWIMQWMPDHHDFVQDDGILTEIGKLNISMFFSMQQLCIALLKHAAQSKFSKELLVSQLTVVLENLLHHLKFISMDLRCMQLTECKMQRIYLELTQLLRLLLLNPLIE